MPERDLDASAIARALAHFADRVRARPGSSRPWTAIGPLGPALVGCPTAVTRLAPPDELRLAWERDRRATRARNVLLLSALASVAAGLAAAGVESLVFKGADALDRLYADPGTRPMDDADLLVHPEQRDAAAVVLIGLGYTPVPIDAGRLGPVGTNLHAARAFRSGERLAGIEIDLHWRLVSDARLRAAFPKGDDRLAWRRAESFLLGGVQVRRLDAVDAAQITALHQILGHPWSHPLGYLDLHLLVEAFDRDRWQALVARTRASGHESLVYWALRFSRELFGTSGVDTALGALAPGRLARRLGERLIDGDWLGDAPFRREMPARDLFVLSVAGMGGALRMLRAGLVDREADGVRRVATVDAARSARTIYWLADAATQTLRRRPTGG